MLRDTKRNEYYKKIEAEIEKKILDLKQQKKSIGNYVKTFLYFWMDKKQKNNHKRNWHFKKVTLYLYGK